MIVEENKKADEAAKIAAERRYIRGCLVWFYSLAHIGRTVTKRKIIGFGTDTRIAATYSKPSIIQ